MKRILIPVALTVMVLFQSGVQAEELLTLTYDAATYDKAPILYPSACTINLIEVSDQRNNKETIGTSVTALHAGESLTWLNAGLDNLKAYGFKVQRGSAPVGGAVNLNVRLIRAYTWAGGMRINGTVAVDLGVLQTDGREEVIKVRAAGSKANMMGAKSEFLTALNYAANNAYGSMASTLQGMCSRNKS